MKTSKQLLIVGRGIYLPADLAVVSQYPHDVVNTSRYVLWQTRLSRAYFLDTPQSLCFTLPESACEELDAT